MDTRASFSTAAACSSRSRSNRHSLYTLPVKNCCWSWSWCRGTQTDSLITIDEFTFSIVFVRGEGLMQTVRTEQTRTETPPSERDASTRNRPPPTPPRGSTSVYCLSIRYNADACLELCSRPPYGTVRGRTTERGPRGSPRVRAPRVADARFLRPFETMPGVFWKSVHVRATTRRCHGAPSRPAMYVERQRSHRRDDWSCVPVAEWNPTVCV